MTSRSGAFAPERYLRTGRDLRRRLGTNTMLATTPSFVS
jgi:hypothetical protein